MPYVTVKEESEEVLHLSREPSSRAWTIFFAIVALGAAAALYTVDYLVWKLAYFSGAVLVGLSFMEEWEDCYFDKASGKVTFKKQGVLQKIFEAGQNTKAVVAETKEVKSVEVQEQDMKYGNVGYVVMLNFEPGIHIGITDVATTDDRSEHELVAKKIRQFLCLDDTAVISPASDAPSNGADDLDFNSASSDEGFEHIDKSELMDEEEEEEEEEEQQGKDANKEKAESPGQD